MTYRKRTALDISRRTKEKLTNPERFALAAACLCDPRTVDRYWAGDLGQADMGDALDAEMTKRKLLKPIKSRAA